MSAPVQTLLAFLLLALGLRLAAFFSGTETGFYRVSFLRLQLDAQAGDRTAQRLIWFARNPSYFVATTLVGNNVAHYLITLALGWITAHFVSESAEWAEVATTLFFSPFIFVLGELVPKSVYYRIPLQRLRRESWWFLAFFVLFLPFSAPLIGLTRLLQRLAGTGESTAETVLGRTQLVQLLSQGHQIGLLTEVQSRLVHGLLHTAAQGVADAVTPAARILGVADTASPHDILEFARKYGLTAVPVRRADSEPGWYGYVRVIDARLVHRPIASLIRPMPRIDVLQTKLEALLRLQEAGAMFGAVYDRDRLIGLVHAHGLAEQLFRPPQTLAAAVPRPPS